MRSWCSRRCRRRRRRASRCRASLKVSRAAQELHGALLPCAFHFGPFVHIQNVVWSSECTAQLQHMPSVACRSRYCCHATVGTAAETYASELN